MALHIPPGQHATLGSEALLADLSGTKPVFRCMKPGQTFCAPSDGNWYAISIGRFFMRLGFRDLIEYDLEGFEEHTFHLGFINSLELQVVHVHGFQRWVKGRECVTCDMLREDLYEVMRSAVQEEVRRVLPGIPSYEDCITARRMLEQHISSRLFRVLFHHGLYMILDSYRIVDFAKPAITIHNWRKER